MQNSNTTPVQLVERHIVKKDSTIEDLCFKSKCLYNYCLYIFRQAYIKGLHYPSEYALSKQLGFENQFDYRNLPSKTSQQVIKLLYKNIKSGKYIPLYSKFY